MIANLTVTGLKGPRPDRWTMGTLRKYAETVIVPRLVPWFASAGVESLSDCPDFGSVPPADQPGADLTLDPYADLETGARLIGQRADRQLEAILTQRSRRLA